MTCSTCTKLTADIAQLKETICHLENLLSKERKWISVSEKLPDHGGWVITYNSVLGFPLPACYCRDHWHDDTDDDWETNTPTHWQELPNFL